MPNYFLGSIFIIHPGFWPRRLQFLLLKVVFGVGRCGSLQKANRYSTRNFSEFAGLFSSSAYWILFWLQNGVCPDHHPRSHLLRFWGAVWLVLPRDWFCLPFPEVWYKTRHHTDRVSIRLHCHAYRRGPRDWVFSAPLCDRLPHYFPCTRHSWRENQSRCQKSRQLSFLPGRRIPILLRLAGDRKCPFFCFFI